MNYAIEKLIILFRCCGVFFGLYFSALGLMIVIGGPDGNAPLESRIIGSIYFMYGMANVFGSLAKERLIMKNSLYFVVLYVVLLLPVIYILLKDSDALTKLPSAYLTYACAVIIFGLVKLKNRINERSVIKPDK